MGMNKLNDFSPVNNNRRPKRTARVPVRLRYLLLLFLGLGILCVSKPYVMNKEGLLNKSGNNGSVVESMGTVTGEPNSFEPVIVQAPVTSEEFRVKRGDTLYDILKGMGLPETSILAAGSTRVEGINPSKLVTGKKYRILSRDGAVLEYQYEPDADRILRIMFEEKEPKVTVEPIPYTIMTVVVKGTIEESLFRAVESINESPALTLDMADIFAWQVDFFRDLRKGDTFSILVDKFYRDGRFIRYGGILAAEFVNNGKSHKAFLFSPSGKRKDYFDETGGSLRKQFLKAPLRFRRVSSGFTRRRLHPVTGRVQAHLGVDYVAPIGTPIRTIGDGKIVLKKKDNVNGRIIKVRHNSVYSSAYAHMNSFAKGLKVGTRVKQGQIMGYVGRSGRATGPHLHFAMYRNGSYTDPRRVSVPRASTVPEKEMAGFMKKVAELSALMPSGKGIQAADGRAAADVVR